jgi:hypothetical protein
VSLKWLINFQKDRSNGLKFMIFSKIQEGLVKENRKKAQTRVIWGIDPSGQGRLIEIKILLCVYGPKLACSAKFHRFSSNGF